MIFTTYRSHNEVTKKDQSWESYGICLDSPLQAHCSTVKKFRTTLKKKKISLMELHHSKIHQKDGICQIKFLKNLSNR